MGLSLTFPISLLLTRISSQIFTCNLDRLCCFHDPLGESLLNDVFPRIQTGKPGKELFLGELKDLKTAEDTSKLCIKRVYEGYKYTWTLSPRGCLQHHREFVNCVSSQISPNFYTMYLL